MPFGTYYIWLRDISEFITDYQGPFERYLGVFGDQEHPILFSNELAETVFFTAQSSYRKVQASKVWNGLKEAWSGVKGWIDN